MYRPCSENTACLCVSGAGRFLFFIAISLNTVLHAEGSHGAVLVVNGIGFMYAAFWMWQVPG